MKTIVPKLNISSNSTPKVLAKGEHEPSSLNTHIQLDAITFLMMLNLKDDTLLTEGLQKDRINRPF